MDRDLSSKLVAEFVGTFCLIFMGVGAVIVGSGISIRVHVIPGSLTEVALFIPTGVTFKEFRSGMRFLSIHRE